MDDLTFWAKAFIQLAAKDRRPPLRECAEEADEMLWHYRHHKILEAPVKEENC